MTPDQLRARAKRIDDGYLASAEDAQALREYADTLEKISVVLDMCRRSAYFNSTPDPVVPEDAVQSVIDAFGTDDERSREE